MKRLLYLIIGLFLCACTENIGPDPSLSLHQGQTQLLEEAFPNRPKELITLPSGIQIEKLDNIYILGKDILLTNDQIQQLSCTRSAHIGIQKRQWPMGIVFYNISSLAQNIKDRIESAITHIETNTGIRFYESADIFPNYVNFICEDGNWSYVGMIGGRQDLSLMTWGSNVGNAVHEICHALGFFHEQARADRDNYITIHWNNIIEKEKPNFQTYSEIGYSNGVDIGSFDFNSIMLYSSYNGFAIDTSKPTMTKKDGSTFVGQRIQLSDSDIAAIKSRYGSPQKGDFMLVNAGYKTEHEGFDITTEYTNIHLVPKKTPTEDMKIEICVSYYQTTTMQDTDDWEWEDTYTITIPAGTRYTTFSYRNLWYQENNDGWKNITGSIVSISPEAFEYRNF